MHFSRTTFILIFILTGSCGEDEPQKETENIPPEFKSQSFEVKENEEPGFELGTIVASDEDGNSLTFSIKAGNESNKFSLNPTSGVLSLIAQLNYDIQNSYQLLVEVYDEIDTTENSVTINVQEVPSAWELLQATNKYSLFASELMEFTDLEEIFKDNNEDLTLFVPTNDALNEIFGLLEISGLKDMKDQISQDILEYHVINQSILFEELINDDLDTKQGEKISVNEDGTLSTGSTADAIITNANIEVYNGLIHEIDRLIIPPGIGSKIVEAFGTIALPILIRSEFSLLEEALKKAKSESNDQDLWSTLIQEQNVTFFAPTDVTFEEVAITLTSFDEQIWYVILGNHILINQGTDLTVSQDEMITGASFSTLTGGSLLFINDANAIPPSMGLGIYIDSDGNVDISDESTYVQLNAELESSDTFTASNGTFHVIYGILAPD